MYTTEEVPGQQRDRWVEFRVRFTNGRVQEVHEIHTRQEYATRPADSTALLADGAGEQKVPDADVRPEVQALLERIKADSGWAALLELFGLR